MHRADFEHGASQSTKTWPGDFYTQNSTIADPHHPRDVPFSTTALPTGYAAGITGRMMAPMPGETSPSGPHSAPSTVPNFDVDQRIDNDLMGDGNSRSTTNHGSWSAADDRTLMLARSQGQGWADIRKNHFPTRTPNACRKRWERLMERPGSVEKDGQRMQRISDEYMAMRKAIWSPLAERMGESWQWVEAQCLSVGLKSIQSSARSHTHRWKRESKRAQQAHEAQIAAHTARGGGLMGFDTFVNPMGPDFGFSPAGSMAASAYNPRPQPHAVANSGEEGTIMFGGYLNGKTASRPSRRGTPGQGPQSNVVQSPLYGEPAGRDIGYDGHGKSIEWHASPYQDDVNKFNRLHR